MVKSQAGKWGGLAIAFESDKVVWRACTVGLKRGSCFEKYTESCCSFAVGSDFALGDIAL